MKSITASRPVTTHDKIRTGIYFVAILKPRPRSDILQLGNNKTIADLEQEEDLAGARIGIKLCSRKGQSAKGIERQRWVFVESAYIF